MAKSIPTQINQLRITHYTIFVRYAAFQNHQILFINARKFCPMGLYDVFIIYLLDGKSR